MQQVTPEPSILSYPVAAAAILKLNSHSTWYIKLTNCCSSSFA